jgi:FkbM family methyltransferase
VGFDAGTLIARALWTTGVFERSELITASQLSAPGTCAFDVGANVGLFTVVMSQAVGAAGQVIAFEPVAETVMALRRNLERNQCANVQIVEAAAAAAAGFVRLILTDDPALHSAGGQPIGGHPTIATTSVKACTLDDTWIAAGRPLVSLVKIDVEGGEEDVLLGAPQMIGRCRPALIIEVNDPAQVSKVTRSLSGYRDQPVHGFEPWNHLLLPEQVSASDDKNDATR